jgi:hypothetical protein
VLPVTRRGLVLTDSRVCWGILVVAMAIAAALILYLNRGTTFYADEMGRVLSSPGFDLRYVIEPHAGHLTVTSNLVVQGMLEAFGTDYAAFRVLGVVPVLLCAGLFYTLARRRIGALPALAPSLVLLVFGSAWELVVIPFGFAVITGTALGLAALLALDRDDRLGDLAACALLCLSVVTFSVGLAFVVGVAVNVLLREDRWRRAWVFIVPALLYTAWWLWTLSLSDITASGDELKATNVLVIPSYIADSLAAVLGSLLGLGYSFEDPTGEIELGWGRIASVGALIALALRIRRGNLPASLWSSLAIVLALWTLGALVVGLLRSPEAPRYLFAGGVAVLLVATDAARSIRFSRLGLAALFAACAVSLATNLALLRDGAAFVRDASASTRAALAAADLARGQAAPDFGPLVDAPFGQFLGNVPASTYYSVVDRYGSPAFSLSELERQSEPVRQDADRALAKALDLRLTESGAPTSKGACREVRTGPGAPPVELPRRGAEITALGAGGPVSLARFATIPTAELGRVAPGETAALRIPVDDASPPWRVSVPGASAVELCPLG